MSALQGHVWGGMKILRRTPSPRHWVRVLSDPPAAVKGTERPEVVRPVLQVKSPADGEPGQPARCSPGSRAAGRAQPGSCGTLALEPAMRFLGGALAVRSRSLSRARAASGSVRRGTSSRSLQGTGSPDPRPQHHRCRRRRGSGSPQRPPPPTCSAPGRYSE